MERLKTFFSALWQLLPSAGLASEYHPSIEGGAIPIPFIVSQRILLNSMNHSMDSTPSLEPPSRCFTSYMQGYTSLPVRDRALSALRSAHLAGARHLVPDIARCALDAGLQNSDLELVAKGYISNGWSAQEILVMRVAEDLYREQSISEDRWKQLKKIYKPQQILDLLLCCAAFHLCVHPQ
ncbi:hypothetical protein GZ77_00685 [Endozoicomonas montiporae]|uniref:Carboxymuconolactone decarboxylase-like domain-containing protein n=2 Tax=Endozoicomonas montiporae TaxID=1027273 RepID=A0A081N9W4_9GAMM|nr:hypothetical protein [Endozoicomonas montiporae]AMO57100.1 carboxymuconolactone decarboxylase [Endozoicomonas montiporae CL-33]KEQ15237.1 hypothetical protein GZ77_00685 [Endozoicomonas montiporae]